MRSMKKGPCPCGAGKKCNAIDTAMQECPYWLHPSGGVAPLNLAIQRAVRRGKLCFFGVRACTLQSYIPRRFALVRVLICKLSRRSKVHTTSMARYWRLGRRSRRNLHVERNLHMVNARRNRRSWRRQKMRMMQIGYSSPTSCPMLSERLAMQRWGKLCDFTALRCERT